MNKKAQTKVLLVDDEPNIVIALEFLVRQEGYQVFKAHTGQEALQLIQIHYPQVVVLDVMMPGMDGFEVARRIRNDESCEDIQIIFLTAKGTREDRFRGYASGGEVYVTKPFDNKELINVINEAVEFG